MGYLYIAVTLIFTVCGHLIIKWRMGLKGELPTEFVEKIVFLLRLFGDPWILSSLFGAFLAALAWMAAMTKFELSYAYPFMSLSFVLVLVFSAVFLYEPITVAKVVGMAFIVAGIIIGSRG